MTDTTDPVEAVARAIDPSAWSVSYRELGLQDRDLTEEQQRANVWQGKQGRRVKARKNARAAIAALEAVGWQIVPKEPTSNMLQAGTEMGLESGAWSEQLYGHTPESSPFHAEVEALYHAIRRAAPSPDTN